MNPNQLKKKYGLSDIIGLDFETFYDVGYSLKSPKMATSEYVRDERFKAQCVGIQTLTQRKPRWYPHEKIAKALDAYDWSTTGLLAHHTQFDGFILSQHYGIVPKIYFDTLSMARPLFSHDIGAGLDEVARYLGYAGKVKSDALARSKGIRDLPAEIMNPLGEYCADDVSDMWNIFRDMLGMDFPEDEIDLIHETVNCFANPVCEVDLPTAKKELAAERRKKTILLKQVSAFTQTNEDLAATAKALGSNESFAEALRRQGIEPPMKPSPTAGKAPIYAFAKNDLDFQKLQAHPDESVRSLIEARIAVKSAIGETRALRMILRGTTGDNKLPLYLNYGKAHTLRWSGGDKFNPQNFPRGGRLRRAIRAPQGYKVVVVDSSQIECRMNAWLWEQQDLLDIFAKNGDPYAELASEVYGYKVTKDTHKKERFVGKVGVLGLGYQMGAEKFQYTLAAGAMGPPVFISLEEADRVKSVFRAKNYRIVAGWRFLENMLYRMLSGQDYIFRDILYFQKDGVTTPSGFNLHYPDLRADYNVHYEKYENYHYRGAKSRVHIYGGKLDENIIQHLARLVVAEQMLKIAERYRVVTMTHDEVVYLAPWREANKAFKFGLETLREPLDWCPDIPLDAEGGFDDVYSK